MSESLPPNPYHGLSRTELGLALSELRQELTTSKRRDAAERAALVQRTVHALIVLERDYLVQEYTPGRPEHAVALGEHPADAYARWFAGETRITRLQAVTRAAEAVFGPSATQWLREDQQGVRRMAIAIGSDEGLHETLELLRTFRPLAPGKR
jgi:hypothetical protein